MNGLITFQPASDTRAQATRKQWRSRPRIHLLRVEFNDDEKPVLLALIHTYGMHVHGALVMRVGLPAQRLRSRGYLCWGCAGDVRRESFVCCITFSMFHCAAFWWCGSVTGIEREREKEARRYINDDRLVWIKDEKLVENLCFCWLYTNLYWPWNWMLEVWSDVVFREGIQMMSSW